MGGTVSVESEWGGVASSPWATLGPLALLLREEVSPEALS